MIMLKSNLNAKSLITALNIWAVAVLKYKATILKWFKEEMSTLDRRKRKLMTLPEALHPKASVNKLYMKR